MAGYYIGIVDRGGAGLGVTFPDLPGCTSGGKDEGDLFAMSIEAVTLWADAHLAEGNAMPRARGMTELLDDAEVQETIAAVGPVGFIQVPLMRDAGRNMRATISLDAGLLEAIDAAAARIGSTRSNFLAGAAREKISRDG